LSDVINYLNSKNIKFHTEGKECVITCPSCGKEKLYINQESLLYQCWVCQAENPDSLYAKGHLSQLQQEWGDAVPILSVTPKIEVKEEKDFTDLVQRCNHNLLNTNDGKKGIKYFYKRGFNEEDIKRFNLGFREMKGESWVVLPGYEDDIPKFLQYRKITNNNPEIKKYEREFGSKSIIFNNDIIDKYDTLNICAGIFDTITLIKNGYENSVCGTAGESSLTSYMYDKIFLKDEFNIILDSDNVGQKAAQNIWAKRLGINRCWNVRLPDGEDVNSYFLKYDKEDFERLLENKYKFKVEGVYSISDALYEMYRMSTKKEEDIFSTPWKTVNTKLGNCLKRKRLIILGGIAGVGKTSCAIQIARHITKKYKIPSMITCLEMDEVDLVTKIVQLENDLVYDLVNYSEALQYERDLEGLEMYFAYSPKLTTEMYYNTVKAARDRYGCELFVFDNLQLLITSDKESDYSKAVKAFKNMAMELDIMIILVNQPRKLNAERNPTYDDLKGSASISQGGDGIVLLHRKRKMDSVEMIESFENKAIVIIDKSRFAPGGKAILKFIGNKSKFEEWY